MPGSWAEEGIAAGNEAERLRREASGGKPLFGMSVMSTAWRIHVVRYIFLPERAGGMAQWRCGNASHNFITAEYIGFFLNNYRRWQYPQPCEPCFEKEGLSFEDLVAG